GALDCRDSTRNVHFEMRGRRQLALRTDDGSLDQMQARLGDHILSSGFLVQLVKAQCRVRNQAKHSPVVLQYQINRGVWSGRYRRARGKGRWGCHWLPPFSCRICCYAFYRLDLNLAGLNLCICGDSGNYSERCEQAKNESTRTGV